jgi:hypothetical protein
MATLESLYPNSHEHRKQARNQNILKLFVAQQKNSKYGFSLFPAILQRFEIAACFSQIAPIQSSKTGRKSYMHKSLVRSQSRSIRIFFECNPPKWHHSCCIKAKNGEIKIQKEHK